jgi:putative oxidoreductase
MIDHTRYLPALGRIMIGGIFAMSGISKLAAYAQTTAMITAAGLPFAPLGWAIAVGVEICLGLMLLLGWRVPASRPGARNLVCRYGGFLPRQFCGPEHDDSLP